MPPRCRHCCRCRATPYFFLLMLRVILRATPCLHDAAVQHRAATGQQCHCCRYADDAACHFFDYACRVGSTRAAATAAIERQYGRRRYTLLMPMMLELSFFTLDIFDAATPPMLSTRCFFFFFFFFFSMLPIRYADSHFYAAAAMLPLTSLLSHTLMAMPRVFVRCPPTCMRDDVTPLAQRDVYMIHTLFRRADALLYAVCFRCFRL